MRLIPMIYRMPDDGTAAGASTNAPQSEGVATEKSPAGEAPASPAPSVTELIATARAELDAWAATHTFNSPIARDTLAYNRIYAALTEIRAALDAIKE